MATLPADFLGALNVLKATGSPQYVGSFCITNEQTQFGLGIRWTQSCLRIDPLGYDAPYYSPRTGGIRNWPRSKSGVRKYADHLFLREQDEAGARDLHRSVIAQHMRTLAARIEGERLAPYGWLAELAYGRLLGRSLAA